MALGCRHREECVSPSLSPFPPLSLSPSPPPLTPPLSLPPTQIDLLRATNAEITSKLSSLEALLAENDDRRHHLQDELAAAEEKQLALEQSRAVLESVGAERLATITLLQSEVEAGRVREEQVGVMAEKLSTLEQLLRTLQEEVREDSTLRFNFIQLIPNL